MSDMNLTNLMDTAFVLLITFMMVAPMIKTGLNLDLPQVKNVTALDQDSDSVTISIRKRQLAGQADQILVEDLRVTLDDLQKALENKKGQDGKLSVVIEAEAGSEYGTFAQVVSLLKQMGVENIGLTTQPVTEEPEKKHKRND